MPELDIAVTGAEAVPFAAAPTLLFRLDLRNAVEEETIHSIILRAQIRIETAWRHYDADAERRLVELFGEPERWGETLRSMLWTHATAIVSRFTGSTSAVLTVPCTYDFDVASSKYFDGVRDGEIPLIFLFSGSVFYEIGGSGLQVAQIPWEKEARFRLPVRVWREMMDRYFPNSTWLRLQRDVFDRLYRYRTERALPTWEATLEHLMAGREAQPASPCQVVEP